MCLLSAAAREDNHAALRRILRGTHFEVVCASSGQDAQNLLLTRGCPVAICDVDLCDRGRNSWLRETHQLSDAPKVIVALPSSGGSVWMDALGMKCYDVLSLPYVPEEVLRVVSLAWRQWKRERGTRAPYSKPPVSALSPSYVTPRKKVTYAG